MSNKVYILGMKFDPVTRAEAVNFINWRINQRLRNEFDIREKNAFDATFDAPYVVFTPNPLMVMTGCYHADKRAIYNASSLSLADGIGVVSAAKRKGTPLPERVTGIDTAAGVIERLASVGGSVFLFGGKPGRAAQAAEHLTQTYPGIRISGVCDGYGEREEALDRIHRSHVDLLCVCLGSPAQESWILDNVLEMKNVGAVMAIGGAVDVWSGNIERAPDFFIKTKTEWLYRMFREPRRFLKLPILIDFRLRTTYLGLLLDSLKR